MQKIIIEMLSYAKWLSTHAKWLSATSHQRDLSLLDVNFIIEDNENFMGGVLIVGGWMEEHMYTCLPWGSSSNRQIFYYGNLLRAMWCLVDM